jgi:hypothetical protein
MIAARIYIIVIVQNMVTIVSTPSAAERSGKASEKATSSVAWT